jgi:hypothetical protein
MRTPCRRGVPADRPRHFCDGGGAGRIASLVPRGAGGPSLQGGVRGGWVPPRREEPAESPMGDRTVRGPTMRLHVRGPHVLAEPSLAFPGPALLSPSGPPCFWLKPAPAFSAASRPSPTTLCAASRPSPPSARMLLRSPRFRQRSRGCDPAGRKRAFACGVPGALPGTWV